MRRLPAIALAALLLAPAAARAAPADTAGFRDWMTACDNVGDCMALGFTEGEYAIGPYLVVQRAAGPDAGPEISVALVAEERDAAAGATVRVTVKGGPRPQSFTTVAMDGDSGAYALFVAAEANDLVRAIRDGRSIDVEVNGTVFGTVSLAGSSAALRWIDDRQGRAGNVTAMVATGPKPASAVPAAKPLPVVRLAAGVSQDNLPTGLPPGLASRADVKACAEEHADPEGAFGSVEAQRLSANEYLWSIPCGRGAYNFSALYVIAGRDGSGARSPGLGDDDTLVNGGYDPESRRLGAFNKGRGFGDCGQEDEFAWDGRRFQPIRRAEMNECRGVPSEHWLVTWRAEAR